MVIQYVWEWIAMVKIGFIVEGNTEKIVINSQEFKKFLKGINLAIVDPVIDAKGNGNLLPQNIEPFINRLKGASAEKIIVITDADQDDISQVKARILPADALYDIDLIVVAVKAFEAWFLACEELMRKVLCLPNFSMQFPERTQELPFEYIKELARCNNVRGPGGKVSFAKKVIKNGFSLREAAAHQNCPSAKFFLDNLLQISRSKLGN